MAIKFLNIRSKEVRVAETEPQLAALWSSSDRSPNITQGQDFGWRLAPEVVVEMKQIKNSPAELQQIAVRYGLPMDAVDEKAILQYISDKTAAENAPVAVEGDYSDEYDQEIRRLEGTEIEAPTAAVLSTEELEAELAARKATEAPKPSRPSKA